MPALLCFSSPRHRARGHSMSTAFRFLTLAATLALVCGCGSSNPNIPATISGRVTYKGTPLPGGNMLFTSQGGGAYPASIGVNGEYTGRGFPVGDMTVTIQTATLSAAGKMAKRTSTHG